MNDRTKDNFYYFSYFSHKTHMNIPKKLKKVENFTQASHNA